MYNEENSTNTNNNLSMEWIVENQTNINFLNIYNNPSIEWSANLTQGYEDPTDNNLPTEWSMNLTQDQTNISLPNVYNNSSIEWSAGFSQDQINNNLPIAIEWPTDFTNNNPFIEWNADFTQYHTNTSLPNIYNNPTIESFAGITRNDGDQTNHKLPIEWTACFTQDQNNTCLPKFYNARVTQHCEEQTNTLQQYNAKSVKKNKYSVSLVSRNERNTKLKCKKCLTKKRYHYNKNPDLCKECYRASFRILSGIKLIDDFIESAQTFSRTNSKLEFIPYEQFTNIEYLAKGGFSVIYKATWVDGSIFRWNPKKQSYARKKKSWCCS
ncbi:hypothetical protein C2G38_2245076 [Gigaspora rosea]|uniref:Protein kinase domain-containing protein n=1 Tax=Gigaspora rosea TaxID=44941 RepID=A0A397VAX0_9GLOM|nr:hypothetical protein C2G38_2245076 [Gigaspora rosea]